MKREEHFIAYRRDADALNEKLATALASADPKQALIDATGVTSALSQSATEHLAAALAKRPSQAERNALADKLAAVRKYSAADLGGKRFVSKAGEPNGDESILVSIATRDAVIAALRVAAK